MGQRGIATDDDYLSGKAHPTVFDPGALDVAAMIEIAHGLKAEDVPPMVRLRVTDESRGRVGRDVFLPTEGETLFDSPSAIARVIRSTAYQKRLVVDAGATSDPNHRPLKFRWVVLRGDAERIVIRPLNEAGSIAEIVVPWHERRAPPWQPAMTGDRVDIGVFADNGAHRSAPAFVSLLYPGNEKRRYRADGQIAEIDYTNPDYRKRYVDPVLFPVRDWRDTYLYDDAGRLTGWDRVRDGNTTRFTGDGLRVIESDALGRSLKAETVAYRVRRGDGTSAEIVEEATGAIVTYAYAGDDDRTGTRTGMPPK